MKRFLVRGCACLICLLGIIVAAPLLFSSPARDDREDAFVIAVVKEMGIPPYDTAVEGFQETLAQKNITPRFKIYDQKDKYLIQKINYLKPALILTLGSTATKFIFSEIKDIPIVFSVVLDPIGSSISSLGVVGASADIPAKLQLETLKAAVPSIKRVGVIYNPADSEAIICEARPAANDLGLLLKTYPVNSEREIPSIRELKIDLLWIIPDNTVCQPAIVTRFIHDGLKNRIAVMGFTRSYAKAGALLGLSCDYQDIGRQSAEIALKILKGENKPDPEITVPRTVKLYLNKTAADLLGVTIPEAVIKKASEVF